MRPSTLLLVGLLTSSAIAAIRPASPALHTTIADRVSGFSAESDAGNAQDARLSWIQRVRRGPGQRVLETTIVNHGDERRCIAVEHRFRFEGLDHRPFITCVEPHPDWPQDGQIACAYVREDRNWMHMGLPFASLLTPDDGTGTSFSADLGNMPILPFEVRMWRDRSENATFVSIRRPEVRLEPNASNVVSLHIASHGGDWREGLAWIRDRWPGLFIVPDGMGRFQWAFWGGTGFFEGAYDRTVGENPLRRGIFQTRPRPWFGLNIADWEPWMIGVDQKYYLLRRMEDIPGRPGDDATVAQIRAFVEGMEPDAKLVARLREQKEALHAWKWLFLTHEKVRNHTQRLVDDGFTWHYYWNASETWRYWSEENFAESLYVPLSQDFWTDSTVLDPFPGSRRAAQLVDDARRIFDNYPNCSGLFLDQVYYDLKDARQDDGVSISARGEPFSRHQWNVWRVLRDIRKLADERGKVLHANFIYNSLEIASLTEFGLNEGMAGLEKLSAFYDIGNRMHICQSSTELTCQQAVLVGWQTNLFSVKGLDENDRRLRPWFNRLWFPIQMMLQERMQVLEPNCLTLPGGFKGNVFRRPDGNVVVPIVTPGGSRMSPYAWSDLPVVVRVSDAARVRRVYQICDDRLGPVALDFERRGRELHITIPRHRAVSMLVLAAFGKFVALADQTVGPAGGSAAIHYDELDRGGRTTRTVEVPAPPGGSAFALIQPDPVVGAVLPDPQWEVDRRPDFELRVAGTEQVTLGPDPAMIYKPHEKHGGLVLPAGLSLTVDEEATVQAALHNHGDEPVTLTLSAAAEGLDVEPGSTQVTVGAGARKIVTLRVRGRQVGKGTLTASAGAAGTKLEIDVVGNRLAAEYLGQIRSARLIVDSISNGAIDEPMMLNGVPAGLLRQRVGHPVWDRRADHILKKEAVAAFKSDGNVLEVSTGKRRFTVAGPILEIELNDGRHVRLQTTDPTQSTPPDWQQGQCQRVEWGGKMRWVFP